MQYEWNYELKPFLTHNTPALKEKLTSLSANLKKLVEGAPDLEQLKIYSEVLL